MKKGILTLLFLFGMQLHAGESKVLENRDVGIVMEIPQDLAKNWEIKHSPTGAKLDIYHSGEKDPEFYVLLLGSIPLEELGCDELESSYLIAQVQEILGGEALFNQEVFDFEITHLQYTTDSEIPIEGYHLKVTDVEVESMMAVDVHLLQSDSHALFLVTAGCPGIEEQKLCEFSKSLIRTIRPIESRPAG